MKGKYRWIKPGLLGVHSLRWEPFLQGWYRYTMDDRSMVLFFLPIRGGEHSRLAGGVVNRPNLHRHSVVALRWFCHQE